MRSRGHLRLLGEDPFGVEDSAIGDPDPGGSLGAGGAPAGQLELTGLFWVSLRAVVTIALP